MRRAGSLEGSQGFLVRIQPELMLSAIFDSRFRMRLRRFPLLHRPLQWLNRSVRPSLRKSILGLIRTFVPARARVGPPRGWFSEVQSLKNGDLEGRIILEKQGSPALPDPSIILLCGRRQHLEQPWPVFWTHHKNARLLGSGLAHLDHRNRVSIEAVYGGKRLEEDPAWTSFGFKKPVRLEGAWTSLINRWIPNNDKHPYAHWLLDALPRLALLPEFPPETGILVPPHQPRYQIESLKLLGLLDRCRPTPEQHLIIEDYYFSAPPSMIVCHSPYAVDYLRRTFLPMLTGIPDAPAPPKRFFIRRTSFGRNMINEQAVLQFFEKRGWTVIDTAALGFLEQIRWFNNAEAICAIHGSGTANMVWCQPGCKFVELFAADYLAGDQEWIAQCAGVEYHFMIFPCDYKLDAEVDLRQVEAKLAELNL